MVNRQRVRLLNRKNGGRGPVAYWMSRDQRVTDNWALLYAREIAVEQNVPLCVVFCLVPDYLNAAMRQYGFMLGGLKGVERRLSDLDIPFHLVAGSPEKAVPEFVKERGIGRMVTDFDPLRPKQAWKKAVSERVDIPVWEVDAHNIVPCWVASPKREYGAYTLRPKMKKLVSDFVDEFPECRKHPVPWAGRTVPVDWGAAAKTLQADWNVLEESWIKPGEKAAHHVLREFIDHRLNAYNGERNDPNKAGQSDLSPYLHFGQISAQRVASEVMKAGKAGPSRDGFLEELIVRRELSDNFCYYNPDYDSFDGFPEWAKKTLDQHRKDLRPYLYGREEFEHAKTHDDLWNAAQLEMVKRGKMHGYMRMYWAKKILEWSESPEQAMEIAVYLNDRYELDGRDPNGYTGIAWSIGGVHDRAWGERDVFGKIRYMSYNGCKSKFSVDSYIEWVRSL